MTDVPVWVGLLDLNRANMEEAFAATGSKATVSVDADKHAVTIDFTPTLSPAMADAMLNVLATLWRGFLGPYGVSLTIPGVGSWDHGEMAVRAAQLR